MRTAICIVNYNCPHFLDVQLQLLKRNVPNTWIYVVETSDGEQCKNIALSNGVSYVHLRTGYNDYSYCHAAALNFAWATLRKRYDLVGFIDHDCFPIEPYTPSAALSTADFLSLNQVRGNVTYPWPGCLFIRSTVEGIDFLPTVGLDTGGRIAEVYKNISPMDMDYQHGGELIDWAWFHIGKGSNWVGTEENAERVQACFDYVKSFI